MLHLIPLVSDDRECEPYGFVLVDPMRVTLYLGDLIVALFHFN